MRMGREFDWLLLLTVVLLCLVGLCLIYSVFHPPDNGLPIQRDDMYFNRQLLWLCVSILAMLLGMIVPFRYFEALAYVFYGACILSLITVYFIDQNGYAQRWIALGPIKIQPSEFTKIALLFVWGRVLSGYRRGVGRPRKLLAFTALTVLPFLLVLEQPDLGTAMVFIGMAMPVLYWRGFKGRHILYMLSPILAGVLILYGEDLGRNPWPFGIYIVAIFLLAYHRRAYLAESISLVAANLAVGLIKPVVWDQLEPYQQRRILNFLEPEMDKLGAGWQVFQSKIAIGSGGIFGKGYLDGTQKALQYVPAKHTDFIFSVLGEEMGFVGAVLVLFLFFVLIARTLSIADKAKSEFASTVCAGIAAYFFFQAFINIAMTTGMAPVTGIPLPFLSYGGSSLVVSCFLIGFLLNCSLKWYEY